MITAFVMKELRYDLICPALRNTFPNIFSILPNLKEQSLVFNFQSKNIYYS